MDAIYGLPVIAAALFIVAVSPGPASIAVATVAMHSGRRPGLLFNLSHPKAVVARMAALSMGLGRETDVQTVVGATLVCMVIGFANYAGYALTFSLPGFMAGYRRGRR